MTCFFYFSLQNLPNSSFYTLFFGTEPDPSAAANISGAQDNKGVGCSTCVASSRTPTTTAVPRFSKTGQQMYLFISTCNLRPLGHGLSCCGFYSSHKVQLRLIPKLLYLHLELIQELMELGRSLGHSRNASGCGLICSQYPYRPILQKTTLFPPDHRLCDIIKGGELTRHLSIQGAEALDQ